MVKTVDCSWWTACCADVTVRNTQREITRWKSFHKVLFRQNYFFITSPIESCLYVRYLNSGWSTRNTSSFEEEAGEPGANPRRHKENPGPSCCAEHHAAKLPISRCFLLPVVFLIHPDCFCVSCRVWETLWHHDTVCSLQTHGCWYSVRLWAEGHTQSCSLSSYNWKSLSISINFTISLPHS